MSHRYQYQYLYLYMHTSMYNMIKTCLYTNILSSSIYHTFCHVLLTHFSNMYRESPKISSIQTAKKQLNKRCQAPTQPLACRTSPSVTPSDLGFGLQDDFPFKKDGIFRIFTDPLRYRVFLQKQFLTGIMKNGTVFLFHIFSLLAEGMLTS